MQRRFRILFYFHNERCAVFELEWLDLPDDSPKSKRFQWYFSQTNRPLLSLQFVNMRQHEDGIQTREFSQAALRFDDKEAVLEIFGSQEKLIALKEAPPDLLGTLRLEDYALSDV